VVLVICFGRAESTVRRDRDQPPYVASGDLAGGRPSWPSNRASLDGASGLDVVSRILAAVPDHLAPGGW
jgi:methylase of polypeptide subunit release factors